MTAEISRQHRSKSKRRRLERPARAGLHLARWGIAIVSVICAVIAMPATAQAAPSSHQFVVPATATLAWVEIDQAGVTAPQVSVEQRAASGSWATVTMITTTFGLHGEFAVPRGHSMCG